MHSFHLIACNDYYPLCSLSTYSSNCTNGYLPVVPITVVCSRSY